LGNEDDINARFVQIDCGHTFEIKGLEIWIGLNSEKGAIKFK
jgi:hypothetical protein